MFHDIIKNNEKSLLPKYNNRNNINGILSYNEFEKKINYLLKHKQVISVHDFLTNKYNKDNDNCILTFDDGLLCHYKLVYPLLLKKNIKASFYISGLPIFEKRVIISHKIQFLITCFKDELDKLLYDISEIFNRKETELFSNLWNNNKISNHIKNTWCSAEIFITNLLRKSEYFYICNELFDKHILKKNNITEECFVNNFYLSEKNIQEMIENGMEIGAHGYSHTIQDTNEDILKVRNLLVKIKVKDFIFTYPNGYEKHNVIYKNNEFKIGFTTQQGNIETTHDKLLLPRFNCTNIKTTNKKIVLCGIQIQGIDICKFLIENNINIDYIVTIDEKKSIKCKASGWIDYSEFAKNYSIPIYYCKKYSLKNKDDLSFFQKEKFDILLLGGWQRLLPKNILDTLNYGALGQHGSSELLPRGRGRSPINWSIIMNRKRLVWNIFFITPGIDDGDIIDYRIIDINDFDTCNTIYKKISIIIKHMYLENIPKIFQNNIKLVPQKGQVTFYNKRTPSDGIIDWTKSINDIYNLVRAVTKPYPGAFTYNGFDKIFIWKAQPFDKNILYYNKSLGEVVEVFDDNTFIVNCCDGTILITEHTANNIYKGDILSLSIK